MQKYIIISLKETEEIIKYLPNESKVKQRLLIEKGEDLDNLIRTLSDLPICKMAYCFSLIARKIGDQLKEIIAKTNYNI